MLGARSLGHRPMTTTTMVLIVRLCCYHSNHSIDAGLSDNCHYLLGHCVVKGMWRTADDVFACKPGRHRAVVTKQE
jgi:hypothetical protein